VNIGLICQTIIRLLEQHYIATKYLEPMIELLAKENYHKALEPKEFAQQITRDLQAICQDRHVYLKLRDTTNTQDWAALEKLREKNTNFGITECRILEGNIGYLKILEFMNPNRGIATAVAAMTILQHTQALIVDLRGNGGGYGGLAEYLISYFFEEEPQLLSTTHFRDSSQTFQSSTLPFVIGSRRIDVPVYILVDQKTGSAAEWFSYILQAEQKAMVIGETTLGAANHNDYFLVKDSLWLSLSTGTPISVTTNSNWERVGVIPDLVCPPEKALSLAHQTAQKRIQRSL
jgi:retinol-binding protein 3